MPRAIRFTFCETVAAVTWHVRELKVSELPCYSGRVNPSSETLCGREQAWDIKCEVVAKAMRLPGICRNCAERWEALQ